MIHTLFCLAYSKFRNTFGPPKLFHSVNTSSSFHYPEIMCTVSSVLVQQKPHKVNRVDAATLQELDRSPTPVSDHFFLEPEYMTAAVAS